MIDVLLVDDETEMLEGVEFANHGTFFFDEIGDMSL